MTSLISKQVSLLSFSNLIKLKAIDHPHALVGHFYGDFGSGKTFVIRSLIRKIINNSEAIAPSPSYGLIYFYEPNIYHCDFYRLHTTNDIESTGIIDQFYDLNTIFFIEWADILNCCNLVPEPYFRAHVSLDHQVSVTINSKCDILNKIGIDRNFILC